MACYQLNEIPGNIKKYCAQIKKSVFFSTLLRAPFTPYWLLFLLLMLTRLVLRNQSLELDEAEQVVYAQTLQAGYPNQPPLYTWLQYFFFQFLPVNLWTLAFLKSLLLTACFYCYRQIARLSLPNESLAWCASAGWALMPAISFDLLKDNTHSVLALLIAALTWLWFIRPPVAGSRYRYTGLGLILAMGILAKFNYLLFLYILIVSLLSLPEEREKWLTPQLLWSLGLAALLSSPYWWWLIQHRVSGLQSLYKLKPNGQSTLHGLFMLGKSVFLFVTPVFLAIALRFKFNKPTRPHTLLTRYFLFAFPLLCVFIIVFGVTDFQTRWLIPILFACPVFFFSLVSCQDGWQQRAQWFQRLCIGALGLIMVTLAWRDHLTHHQARNLALQAAVVWVHQHCANATSFVSDSYWLLGNLKVIYPARQIVMQPLPDGKPRELFRFAQKDGKTIILKCNRATH